MYLERWDTVGGRCATLATNCKATDIGRFTPEQLDRYTTVTAAELHRLHDEQKGCASTFLTQQMSPKAGEQWQMTVDRIDNSLPHCLSNIRLTALEFNPHGCAAPWTTDKEDELLRLLSERGEASAPWQRLSYVEKRKWAQEVINCCELSATCRKRVEERKAIAVKQRQADNAVAVAPRHLLPFPDRGVCTITVQQVVNQMNEQEGRCSISNVPLSIIFTGRPSNDNWKASAERVDYTGGYTVTNTVFSALEFNTIVRPWATAPSTSWTKDKFNRWFEYLVSRRTL